MALRPSQVFKTIFISRALTSSHLQVPLPHKVTYSQVPGVRTETSLGPLSSWKGPAGAEKEAQTGKALSSREWGEVSREAGDGGGTWCLRWAQTAGVEI